MQKHYYCRQDTPYFQLGVKFSGNRAETTDLLAAGILYAPPLSSIRPQPLEGYFLGWEGGCIKFGPVIEVFQKCPKQAIFGHKELTVKVEIKSKLIPKHF